MIPSFHSPACSRVRFRAPLFGMTRERNRMTRSVRALSVCHRWFVSAVASGHGKAHPANNSFYLLARALRTLDFHGILALYGEYFKNFITFQALEFIYRHEKTSIYEF